MNSEPQLDDRATAGLLADLGIALVEASDIGELLQRLADAAREVSRARYAAIGVLNARGDGLVEFVTAGVDEATRERIGDLPTGRGLLGAIIRERTAIRVDDIATDERSAGFPPGHPPMTSFMGLPIHLGDRVFGNIYVTDSAAGSFSDEDQRLLETLAAYAAIAVRGAEIRAERQLWIDGLEGICAITGAVGRLLDMSELLPEAVRRSRSLLRCDTVGIGLLGGDGRLRFPFAHGPHALTLEAIETSTPGLSGVRSALDAELPDLDSMVEPLVSEGRTLGALIAIGNPRTGPWQARVMEVLAQHIAIAVGNAGTVSEQETRIGQEWEDRLEETRERLRHELTARTLAAQEEERTRVARELHDEAGQLLTGVGLRLKALEPAVEPEVAGEIAALRDHVRDAQTSMRQILRRLRPVDLEHGLTHAITEMAGRIQESSGCDVVVEVAALPAMSDDVELVLFRACQEALTNVARHSEATRADVSLVALEGRLRLTIEDNGVGFDPGETNDRFGLGGVAERVELVGGHLRLQSAPGAGTAVTVDVDAAGPPRGEETSQSLR